MRLDPDEWAAVYESPRPSAQQFVFRHGAEVARQACLERATPGERWIDVGCGTGHLAAELAVAGLDVVGVDSDPTMVREAERRFGSEVSRDRLRFRVAEADRLGLGDATVDGVVATSLVGCLEDATPFLREVRRVLRPGGCAVITFTNRASVLHALNNRLSAQRERRSALVAPVRLYSEGEVARELAHAGLAVVEIRYYNCFVGVGTRMFPPRRVALLLERAVRSRAGRLLGRNLLALAMRSAD